MQTLGPFSLPVSDDTEWSHLGAQKVALGDVDAAVSGASAPEPPLPCLLSNNSDEIRVKLSGNDRKRAEQARRNLEHLAGLWGERAGVMTMTLGKDLPTKEANRKRANFTRRVLKENFGEFVVIREFTHRGRVHWHILIDCLGDIRTGFNWDHYDLVREWSRAGRKGAKPHGQLGRSPLLARLQSLLREKAPLYGLGERIELVPVRYPAAIGFYLGGYLSKDLAHRPGDAKGTRSVNYSHKCPRVFRGRWSWNSAGAWVWRAKLRKFAEKHSCATFAELRALLGPRWAYHHRAAIQAIHLDYYATAEQAAADGLYVPAGATEIRREVFVDGVKLEPKKLEVVRHPSWDGPAPEPRKYQLSRDFVRVPVESQRVFYALQTATQINRTYCLQRERGDGQKTPGDSARDVFSDFCEVARQVRFGAPRKNSDPR